MKFIQYIANIAKIFKKIHEFAHRENPRKSNTWNLLVNPAQTLVALLYMFFPSLIQAKKRVTMLWTVGQKC